MTTIATDGRTLASDSRTTCGGLIESDRLTKLVRLPDGSVAGWAGTNTNATLAVEELADAIAEDRHPKLCRGDYKILRLQANGTITFYGGELVGFPVPPPAAIGSGECLAIGAMETGASPKEAVRIAKKRDVYSGGRIQEMEPR